MSKTKVKATSKKSFWQVLKKDASLYMFCLPSIVLTFIFSYIPMYGVQIAFQPVQCKRRYLGKYLGGTSVFQTFY